MKIWLKRVSFVFGEGKVFYLELRADGTLPDTIRLDPRWVPWAHATLPVLRLRPAGGLGRQTWTELKGQTQPATSNSDMARPPFLNGKGVEEKGCSASVPRSTAFATHIKPLPVFLFFVFFQSFNQLKRLPSVKPSWDLAEGPIFLGWPVEAGVEVVRVGRAGVTQGL